MTTSDFSRFNEMRKLRLAAKWTLQQIGEKFGISRERVRQLIGNTGGKSESFKAKNHKHIENGTAKIASQAELLVSQKLSRRGIKHQLMPYLHPYDIETESGLRIEVKASSIRSLDGSLHFNIGTSYRGDYADFFILVSTETKDVFVVPSSEITNSVRFQFPAMTKRTKYSQYHNRFDLLK